MRILLVEDEPDLGEAIQRSLSRDKYVVDWVLDGTEAWNYLDNPQVQYTVAVLDWLLPGLSGVELCQRLRLQKNPLPVLMLTAKDSMADRVTGLDAGADDYLIKPFGMAELKARIRALGRRSQSLIPPTASARQSLPRLHHSNRFCSAEESRKTGNTADGKRISASGILYEAPQSNSDP